MRTHRITLFAAAVVAVVALVASAQTVRPRLTIGTMPPEADAARILVYPAGGAEADAAMAEITATLAAHGCQLEVHRRAQADCSERTVIVVQSVQRVAAMP